MSLVRKAVIPAAGFGTRLLPASKAVPKELLPIVDVPVIQYVVEEAVAAGITDILIVIGAGKQAIEAHFGRQPELERALERQGRAAEIEALRRLSTLAAIHYVWQHELKGLGDAVACAAPHVGREPFALLLGDTLLEAAEPVTAQLVRLFEQRGGATVALETVPWDRVHRYGIVDGHEVDAGVFQIRDVVEKPDAEEAPSNLAFAGRYVFGPEIFDHLARTGRGKNDEIQLTDAMRHLVAAAPMYGLRFDGRRHDIGNRLDFVKTNVRYALRRPDLREDLLAFLREIVKAAD